MVRIIVFGQQNIYLVTCLVKIIIFGEQILYLVPKLGKMSIGLVAAAAVALVAIVAYGDGWGGYGHVWSTGNVTEQRYFKK